MSDSDLSPVQDDRVPNKGPRVKTCLLLLNTSNCEPEVPLDFNYDCGMIHFAKYLFVKPQYSHFSDRSIVSVAGNNQEVSS